MIAKLMTGESKKTGSVYYYLDIEIAPNYHKKCFLDAAEVALVKLAEPDEEF